MGKKMRKRAASPSLDDLPASDIAEFLGEGSYLNASLASKAAKELVKGAGRKTYGPETAARRGNLELLKWLHFDQGRPLERVCAEAALGGHLEVLKWARENGCDWDQWNCARAARGGHLEVLKWAFKNGLIERGDAPSCALAAEGGHLDVVKWLSVVGGSWIDAETLRAAALNDHFHLLEWAVRKFQKEKERYYEKARYYDSDEDESDDEGHLLRSWNYDESRFDLGWEPYGCISEALAKFGDVEAFASVVGELGCYWHRYMCMQLAHDHHHPELLDWINNYEEDDDDNDDDDDDDY